MLGDNIGLYSPTCAHPHVGEDAVQGVELTGAGFSVPVVVPERQHEQYYVPLSRVNFFPERAAHDLERDLHAPVGQEPQGAAEIPDLHRVEVQPDSSRIFQHVADFSLDDPWPGETPRCRREFKLIELTFQRLYCPLAGQITD